MSGTIKLEEGSGGDHVGFKAPADIAAEVIWELPATDGEIMATDGFSLGKLDWTSVAPANRITELNNTEDTSVFSI